MSPQQTSRAGPGCRIPKDNAGLEAGVGQEGEEEGTDFYLASTVRQAVLLSETLHFAIYQGGGCSLQGINTKELGFILHEGQVGMLPGQCHGSFPHVWKVHVDYPRDGMSEGHGDILQTWPISHN